MSSSYRQSRPTIPQGSNLDISSSLTRELQACSCMQASTTASLSSSHHFASSLSSSLSSSLTSTQSFTCSPVTVVPCLSNSQLPSPPSPSSPLSTSTLSSDTPQLRTLKNCEKDSETRSDSYRSWCTSYSTSSSSSPSSSSSTASAMTSTLATLRCPPVALTCLLILASLYIPSAQARSAGVCLGVPCANGGQRLVSNSVWGSCRCRCQPGFVGPFCQYQAARKRSAGNARRPVGRLAEMVEIRQRLLALQQRLDQGEPTDQDSRVQLTTDPDTSLSGSVQAEDARLESFTARQNRPRRSWYPKLTFRR